jgi:flagellar assembly protein FliH
MSFVFDRDFDEEEVQSQEQAEQKQRAIYTPEDLNEAVKLARAEAYEDGRLAGRTEATMEHSQSNDVQLLHALETLGPLMQGLLEDADKHHAALEAQILDFVMSVFQQVAPDVVRSLAVGQAEAEVHRAIGMALDAAYLIVHLPMSQADELKESIQREARRLGHGGRIDVMGDPEMQPGDARVEWDQGFMQYSYSAICGRILEALSQIDPQT